MIEDLRLLPPASYFPISDGRYEIRPGLFPLNTDFGNDRLDTCTFQIDNKFEKYLAEKQNCRAEQLEKYFLTRNLLTDTARSINAFIIDTLLSDYPDYFTFQHDNDGRTLHCLLTRNNVILRNHKAQLSEEITLLDQLAMQIQEDLAIVQLDQHNNNTLSALHLCFPNYWSAQEKIGQNFIAVHKPVPGMERINQRATELIQAIINKGPFVRFAWGLTTDTRLNHHPSPPPAADANVWQGRDFDAHDPELYMRIERQTMHGFPKQWAVLFTIRTYFQDVVEIKQNQEKRQHLIGAISSMPESSLVYKGLIQSRPEILNWLKNH